MDFDFWADKAGVSGEHAQPDGTPLIACGIVVHNKFAFCGFTVKVENLEMEKLFAKSTGNT